MSSLGELFLGLIAISVAIQTTLLVLVSRRGTRLASQLEELKSRVDREIRPTLDNLSRVTRNLSEVSDLAVLQARRVDDFLADTIDKVEETTSTLRRLILRPLGPLADLAALLKGIRRGVQVYRHLRGFESRGKVTSPPYSEDEHLFI